MNRHAFRWLPVLLAGILLLCCSSDNSTQVNSGSLLVRYVLDPGAEGVGVPRPDSVDIVVRDASQNRLAEAAAAFADSAPETFTFELSPGEDRTVLVRAEGTGASGERGAVYFGSREGISIERGRTAETLVTLYRAVPGRPEIDGAPGESAYLLRWGSVRSATGYVLREYAGDGLTDFADTDTAHAFSPAAENGTARLSGSRGTRRPAESVIRCYGVRAELPLGPGVFGDSTCFDFAEWTDLPRVVEATPADSATGVINTTDVRIRFDRPMDAAALGDSLVTLRALAGTQNVAMTRVLTEGGSVLVLTPASPLLRGLWYRARVSTKARDADGRFFDQDPLTEGLQAYITDFRIEIYDPLRVVEVSPAANAVDVTATASVLIRFNKSARASSVTTSTFTLSGPSGPVSGSVRRIDGGGTQYELDPAGDLGYSLEYTVHVDHNVVDDARGEPLDQDPSELGLQEFVSSFSTTIQPVGPKVAWHIPADNEDQVAIDDTVQVVFDRAVDPATFVPTTSVLLQLRRGNLWFNVPTVPPPYTTDGVHFALIPNRNLEHDTSHRLVVAGGPGGIRDAQGIPLDQDYSTPGFQSDTVSFRTEQTVWVDRVTPTSGQTGVGWGEPVRITFSMPVRPESVNETTFILKELGGTLPVSATRTVLADSLVATLVPADSLAGYTDYEVTVTTGIRSRRGGRLDQSPDVPGHQSFRSTFRTASETVPPRVVEVHPSDGATGVPVGTSVQVVFSEPVHPDLVKEYFTLKEGSVDGPLVAGPPPDVAPDNLSARFTPSGPLKYLTAYHVQVGKLVTDLFGNGLDQDPDTPGKQEFHSVFTTQVEQERPTVTAVVPADGAGGISVDGAIQVDFNEAMDRASVALGFHVEKSGAAVTGNLTFSNGDRRVTFTPEAPLAYASLYAVRVDSLAHDLAGNGLDQYPDTGLHDPFESEFTTEGDAYGPVIVEMVPADGDSTVEVVAAPFVRFDEALDPASVTAASITLADSTGEEVAVARALDAAGTKVTLTPGDSLAFETLYRITVTPLITDLLGNPFDGNPSQAGDQSFVSTFRTRIENIPPRVVSVDPEDEAEGVPVGASVRVVFNEPVDAASVTATTFSLLLDQASVPATRAVSAAGDTATLVPDNPLGFNTNYRVRVQGVRDRHGNLLDQDRGVAGEQAFESIFTTAPEVVPPPHVVRFTPADGALNYSASGDLRLVFSQPMDTASFDFPGAVQLTRNGYAVGMIRTVEPGDTAFVFSPDPTWARGRYRMFASSALTDKLGNHLDPTFESFFEVGRRPIPVAGDSICADGDTTRVEYTGSASSPDDAALASIVWSWGDGSPDSSYAYAGGTVVAYTYDCPDTRGCDGLDNDADGEADECDESYHAVMTVTDEDGLRAADTTGVAFCAFIVRTSDPADGAVGVPSDKTIRITFTRACDSLSVDATSVLLKTAGGSDVPATLGFEDDYKVVAIDPVAPLEPDSTYVVHVTTLVKSATGKNLDQGLCVAGSQEFTATFTTAGSRPGAARVVRPGEAFRRR